MIRKSLLSKELYLHRLDYVSCTDITSSCKMKVFQSASATAPLFETAHFVNSNYSLYRSKNEAWLYNFIADSSHMPWLLGRILHKCSCFQVWKPTVKTKLKPSEQCINLIQYVLEGINVDVCLHFGLHYITHYTYFCTWSYKDSKNMYADETLLLISVLSLSQVTADLKHDRGCVAFF